MSNEPSVATCPICGVRRSGTFLFCTACGAELPRAATPSPPPPPIAPGPPSRTQRLPAKPAVPVVGQSSAPRPPSPPPSPSPVVGGASGRRSGPTIWHLRWILPIVSLLTLILVVAKTWFGGPVTPPAPPKQVVLTLNEETWRSFDPRAAFGVGREFFVRADRPIRIRTASGGPVVTGGMPVALGDVGDRLELRSVRGGIDVVLVGR